MLAASKLNTLHKKQALLAVWKKMHKINSISGREPRPLRLNIDLSLLSIKLHVLTPNYVAEATQKSHHRLSARSIVMGFETASFIRKFTGERRAQIYSTRLSHGFVSCPNTTPCLFTAMVNGNAELACTYALHLLCGLQLAMLCEHCEFLCGTPCQHLFECSLNVHSERGF